MKINFDTKRPEEAFYEIILGLDNPNRALTHFIWGLQHYADGQDERISDKNCEKAQNIVAELLNALKILKISY